ncbi:MAG: hypothetical protein ABSF17_13165 [Terracidiphilus sp.]|jgi:hypothetical protein
MPAMKSGILTLALVTVLAAQASGQPADAVLARKTSSISLAFDAHRPGLRSLSVDSLKRGNFGASPIVDPGVAAAAYSVSEEDGWVRYAPSSSNDKQSVAWEMRCDGDAIRMRSFYLPGAESQGLTLRFDPNVVHATLLGHVTSGGDIALPAILHLPGMGSLRVYAQGDEKAALRYAAHRAPAAYVEVTFPAATAVHPKIEYTLEVATIYPAVPGLSADDPSFDGFRRDFLDIFQQQAELHVLANNAASDPCAFTVYEYADMARYTPELVQGLTALDLVRDTLDRYLGGFLAYGMPGYRIFEEQGESEASQIPYVFSDVYPSLLIAAYDYADGSADRPWLRKNYPGLRKWAENLVATNADGRPFVEYPVSGNSGSWTAQITVRPANWWDTIGFGHEDAYSNALAYRALRGMANLADRVGEQSDAARYRLRAQQIHDAYPSTFIDPATGVVSGWRSSDGQLHNYFFPFVNGIAVRYGLVEGQQARNAMNGIFAKMQSVGYRNFALGLPGNLVPIRRADYVDLDPRFGGPTKEDGSDGFQIYENGGATACFSYFTMAALYKIGDRKEGDAILLPMVDAFAKRGFSGRGANGLTNDWRDWQGGAHGYEGFLADNYYALLAVLDRSHLIAKLP